MPGDLETPHTVDRHIQRNQAAVDVLFVVDNSSSMEAEQDELALNFPLFLSWFTGSAVDYHIGVTSMDMDHLGHRGRLRSSGELRWIDPMTADADLAFAEMVDLGTHGSVFEEGIAAAYAALELRADLENTGFRRFGTSLVVIAISDEDDQSDDDLIDVEGFIDWLNDQKTPDADVVFSSVVTPPGTFGPGAEVPGNRYRQVTNAVGGQTWDIRIEDWSPVLDGLGMQALGMQRSFYLSSLPREDTIEVFVEIGSVVFTFEPQVDWTYDPIANAVTFVEFLPPPGAAIEVAYEALQ